MLSNNNIKYSRWRVAWLAKGRVVSKSFGSDFSGAADLYAKAKAAGKTGATLIVTNFGFEPPDRLKPRKVRKVRKEIVLRKGRRRVVKEVIEGMYTPLKKLNAEGIWWCPYCAKLRKFELKDGFYDQKAWVPEPGYHCPICEISHRDGTVRKWNPAAARIYAQPGRRLLTRSGAPRKKRRR